VGSGGNDTDKDLVWIDPKIWEKPTPTVQCFFPCTLVLPPFPAETYTTIDYPRVALPEGLELFGILVFPPVTVTEYALSTAEIAVDRRRQIGGAETTIEVSKSGV
jgi:chitinase